MGKFGTIAGVTLAGLMLATGVAFAVPQSKDWLLDNFAKHSTVYKTQVEENNSLKAELKATKADLSSTEQELGTTKSQLTRKETELDEVTTLYDESSRQLASVTETLASTTSELETTKTTLAEKENQVTTLTEEKTMLLNNVTELDNQINETTDQTTLENLSQKMTEMLNKVDNLNTQIVTLQNEITNLNDTVSSLQAQIQTLENEKTQLSTQVGSLQMQITALEQDKIDLQSQVDNLQIQVNEKQTRIETLENQIAEMGQYNAYVQESVNYFDITLVQTDTATTGSYFEIGTLSSDVTETTSKSTSTTSNSIILKYLCNPTIQYTSLTKNYNLIFTLDDGTTQTITKTQTYEDKVSAGMLKYKYLVRELQNNLTIETLDGQILNATNLHPSYKLEFKYKSLSIGFENNLPASIIGVLQTTLTMAELQNEIAKTTAMDNAVGTYSYSNGTQSLTLTINNDLTASLAVTIDDKTSTISIKQTNITFVNGKLVLSGSLPSYTITQIDDTSWSLSYSYTSGTAYPVGTINGTLTKN